MAGPKNQDAVVGRFGVRLRETRIARGMTQAVLAERAEVSVAYIGRLERGEAAPGIDLVARLATALGVKMAELLPESDPPPDAVSVLRERCRSLFEEIVESGDLGSLTLLVQVLARLAEALPDE